MSRLYGLIVLLCVTVAAPAVASGGSSYADTDATAALSSLESYRATGEARHLNAAQKTVDFITGRLYKKARGVMHAAVGEPDALRLADQVYPALAALQLYEATGDGKYLTFAVEIAALLEDRFSDKEHGGYLDASRDRPMMENAKAALLLIDLFHITGKKPYKEAATHTLASFSKGPRSRSRATAPFALAAGRLAATTYEFIVVGKADAKDTAELVKKAYTYPDPDRVVVTLDPVRDKGRLGELGYEYEGRAILYVCSEKTCFPPVLPGGSLVKTRECIEKARRQEAR